MQRRRCSMKQAPVRRKFTIFKHYDDHTESRKIYAFSLDEAAIDFARQLGLDVKDPIRAEEYLRTKGFLFA